MSLKLVLTTKFKKDYRLCKSRGLDTSILDKAIKILAEKQKLPAEYKDHHLLGN